MRRFKNILLIQENSHLSTPSALRAIELARSNSAKLTIIDVLPRTPIGRSLQSFSEKVEKLHARLLEERRREMEESFFGYLTDIEAKIEVLSGRPFMEIIRYTQRHDCDLVIKSAEKEKLFSSLLLGSTDLKLLRKCPCPVWVVKPDDYPASKKILAAVELESFIDDNNIDSLNEQIVEIASSLAHRQSAELHLVNAYVIFDGGRLAKKLSKNFEEDSSLWVEEQLKNIGKAQSAFQSYFSQHQQKKSMASLECRYHFIEGQAKDVIVDLVEHEGIDLVVMGTVGRSDLAGFLVGNTSEAVLSQINCSVLAVKPPGFISPVPADNG